MYHVKYEKFKLVKKLVAKKASYRMRHLTLTSHDQVQVARLRKIIAFIAAKIQSENAPKDSILWTQLRTVFNMKVALEYRIKDDDAPDLTTTIY